jgi:hypothetical protein
MALANIRLGYTQAQEAAKYIRSLVADIRSQLSELAELRERLRWRTFSKEKPRDGQSVLLFQEFGPRKPERLTRVVECQYRAGLWTNENWHGDVEAKSDDLWLPMPTPEAK